MPLGEKRDTTELPESVLLHSRMPLEEKRDTTEPPGRVNMEGGSMSESLGVGDE